MLKQINILRDPMSSGGGGNSSVTVQGSSGQTLQGQLVEGDDNFAPDDGDNSGGEDNIFDLGQFKDNATATKPSSSDKTVEDNETNKDNLPPAERLPKKSKADEPKKKVVKDEEPTEEEVVVEDEPVVEEEVEEDNKQQQLNKDKRDYTGLTKEEIDYLKKLPNGVFNHVAPLMKKINEERASWKPKQDEYEKYKKDPTRVPDNWYEHPEAYTLSPKFADLSKKYQQTDFEARHWEQQLINLRTAKAFVPLEGYDAKTGEYKFGAEVKDINDIDAARLEVQMQQVINRANILKQNYNGEAEKLRGEFSAQHQAISTYYDKADEMIKTLPQQFQPKEEHMKKFEDVLHPSHKGTGVGKLLSKMYSIIINQGVALAEYNKAKQTSIKNNLDNKAAGPKSKVSSSAKANKPSSNNGDEEIDFSKLKQEMEN